MPTYSGVESIYLRVTVTRDKCPRRSVVNKEIDRLIGKVFLHLEIDCPTKMKSCNEWKPFFAMISIEFAFSIVNILLKKVLDQGMKDLVFITYRLSISTIFLAPIGYFWER